MKSTVEAPANTRQWWEDYLAAQWDANNGRDQSKYFMQRLVENLPPVEREYLVSQEATILDWGCAFGDGVNVLSEVFPNCRITGMDFAERAVAEASRSYPALDFKHTPDGAIGELYDVIFCSHCLEHFADPLPILKQHLLSCRSFYVLLTSYKEAPLCANHMTQFDEESFPSHLAGFKRIATKVVDSDPKFCSGQMLLVVYASAAHLRGRESIEMQIRERQKWDEYYAGLSAHEIDAPVRKFGEELATEIFKFLPDGSSVLEAGCGAGWQSMLLAESGKVDVTLMDFSSKALEYAQRSFERQGLSAKYLCQNAFMPGKEEYDLVFNAGVLEHYTFDEQVSFLQGMASRSKKYVLVLVPNRFCYWYWIWRVINASQGDWHYGKEVPLSSLSAAFEAAGMTFLGEWFGGGDWSEDFITGLPELNADLCENILAVHRSRIIPSRQRAYLTAALGCKGTAVKVPVCWETSEGSSDFTLDQLTASVADSLAANVSAAHRCKQLDIAVAEREQKCIALRGELAEGSSIIDRLGKELADLKANSSEIQELNALKSSLGYRTLLRLWKIRSLVVPPHSRRASAIKFLWRFHKPREVLGSLRRVVASFRRRFAQSSIYAAHAANGNRQSRSNDTGQLPLVPGLVSVVLPVYNHAHLLRAAVDSVLAQSYRQLELIIVNDGSTDSVEKVLTEYVKHPSVRVLTQPNQGLPKALSNGFEFARGEFWTWTSADNIMHVDQLQQQVKFLQKHAETAMVYANYTAIDAKGRPLSDPTFRPHNRRSPDDPAIHLPNADSFGRDADNFIGPCFLYRGKQGRLLGEYEPTMGIEDFDYWLRMKLVGKIAHLGNDKPLYSYRVHDASLSGRAAELQIPEQAKKLIQHHRVRENYFAKPWTIHVDEKTLARMSGAAGKPHSLVSWDGRQIQVENGDKRMLLVHASKIPEAVEISREAGIMLAVWFSPEQHGLELFRNGAQGAIDLCFAEYDDTLNRLALMTPDLFRAKPGSEMISLATKWADSRTFSSINPSASAKVLTLPEVFRAKKRAVRILLQADGFTQGGMEQVVIDLAESLRTDRFDVALLVLGEQGEDADRMRKAGFPVLSLPEENRELHYRRLLQERQIDLVNAHYSLFGAKTAAETGTPFVQTIHNTYIFLPPDQYESYRANDKYTSAYACVSQMAAHYSDVKLGLPASKMIVTPNGIHLQRLDSATTDADRRRVREQLGFSDDVFMFLNVSSIQPIKCQAFMVRAFAEVVRDCPDAKLVLVGRAMSPDYLQAVKQEIADHGLENDVVLAGHHKDALSFYAAADAFLLPSLCEGWSLAMAEALGAGLPVAATAVGSAPELLPRFDGRLIRTPFGSMTNLDFLNLDQYTSHDDPQVKEDLIAAMVEFYRARTRRSISTAQRRELDCREAYKPYGNLFLWLLHGGHPIAARTWTMARRARSKKPLVTVTSSCEQDLDPGVQSVNNEVDDISNTSWQRPPVLSMSPRLKRLASEILPATTRRGRLIRNMVDSARRVRRGFRHCPKEMDLAAVLREADGYKGIVIYPPLIDWSWMRQRPHQLMAEFAKAGYLSIFCSPQKFSDSFKGFTRVAERLYLCESIDLVYHLPNPIILISWVDHWEMIKEFSSPLVIYDYLDSLSVSSPNGDPAPQKIDWHNKLLIQSDIVLATAKHLHEEVKPLRPDVVYCPNGVEYDHFRLTAAPPVPADIADLVDSGRPIIGYFGAFARWFDYELLAHAAKARKDCIFLLIGPDFDGTLAASPITQLPNIRWLGEKKYQSLPSYLYYFSVATIPFRINEITKCTSPVKLFEYMAGGKPIVATDMPECRKYPCVMIAQDADDFVALLDKAILRGKTDCYQQELDREARENTWERRGAQIIKEINAVAISENRHSA